MGLLSDAAAAWNNMCDTYYIFDIARKRKSNRIKLSFLNADFPHLAGMQYAKDVDFGLRRAEYYGERLVSTLLDKRLDDSKIEESRNWGKISGRLTAIINLQNTLDNDFTVVSFNKSKVRGFCRIDAKYVIKSTVSDDMFFIFLDEQSGRYYCKSAFKKEYIDYTENQSVMTVLQKVKVVDGAVTVLFTRSGYGAAEIDL
ncbi:MAG: PBECR4 domain-containing protein [Oscillospiraceae bacterium]|nr:PBECR4 domain-containing protein [Oscillospiraceae bacterium]